MVYLISSGKRTKQNYVPNTLNEEGARRGVKIILKDKI